MTKFNEILDAGRTDDGYVNVVIEMSAGSTNKIEWRRDLGLFELDRVKPQIFAKPTNYGFVPRTIDEDGDELDALVITDQPLPTGIFLEGRIVGVMKFEDNESVDDKIIVVPKDDLGYMNEMKSLNDIPKTLRDAITHHFTHYKDFKQPGLTHVKGYGDIEEAKEVIRESIKRWQEKYSN